MPHIKVEEGIPGIRSLVLFRPETGKPLYDLAQVLLRGPSPLTEAERELIAAYVSHRNECVFCTNSHAAAARCLYEDNKNIVDEVLRDMQTAAVSDKMKALLIIAAQIQQSGKNVTVQSVQTAKSAGATDIEIHDTVLIAALFCLYNRYVDGLATVTPTDPAFYKGLGERLKNNGYNRLTQGYDHLKK